MFNTIVMLLIAVGLLFFMAYLTWDTYKEFKSLSDKNKY